MAVPLMEQTLTAVLLFSFLISVHLDYWWDNKINILNKNPLLKYPKTPYPIMINGY